jgi:hypothetical protein
MPSKTSNVSPSITTLIRLDHLHVLAAFHRYHRETPWWRKRAIVNSACVALEIHAQLEEDIFYPALARAVGDNKMLQESGPQHDAIRAIIARLRVMGPENAAYDALFMQLMRDTLHHVADEETVLLPMAERALKDELSSLGAQMTRKRMELLGRRPVEIALNTAGTFPIASLLIVSAIGYGVRLMLRGGPTRSKGRRVG